MTLEPERYIRGLQARRAASELARTRTVATVHQELGAGVALLRHRYGVTRVVLFGSFARGDARPDSDVDLLVHDLSAQDYFAAAADLSRVLRRDVDLVRVEDAGSLLLERVAQQGARIDG